MYFWRSKHRLLECLDGWEGKLNCQQCQQTVALANSCIPSFEGSNVSYKSLKQWFLSEHQSWHVQGWPNLIIICRAINQNYHCFAWNFNSGFQNIGFVLGTKNTVKSLVSAECLFMKAKSSNETTQTVHKSLKWNLDNCKHENLCTIIIFAKQPFLLTNFTQRWWFQAMIIFLKKRQLKILTFAVKATFYFIKAMFILCIFSSKDP